MHLEACCALPQVAGSGGSMWGHCDGGAGGRKTRPGPSPGSTAEEGGPGGRRKDFEEGSEEGETGDDNSPPNNGRDPPEDGVIGERKGGSDIKMEGGGYYPSVHPGNHHGGGVHQPLVRGGGGYPGGPRDPGGALEEGEVRRSRGPSATRDGVVIIERRPSQEGIQPAEMQVLMITSSRSISLSLQLWILRLAGTAKEWISQFGFFHRTASQQLCLSATLTLDQSPSPSSLSPSPSTPSPLSPSSSPSSLSLSTLSWLASFHLHYHTISPTSRLLLRK